MAEIPAFGQREALKALQKLGFIIDTSSGKGSHAKAKHPTKHPDLSSHQPPLMTIPHRREFGSHAQGICQADNGLWLYQRGDISRIQGQKEVNS